MTATFVSVSTYTHSVAYLTDKMLVSLKDIVRWSGLYPSRLVNDWGVLDSGIRTWLLGEYLLAVVLEIFNPETGNLVVRWDFDIRYTFDRDDDGAFWVDTDAIQHAIKKCGLIPARCSYQIVVSTKPNSPKVPGWAPAQFRPTDGFAKHLIGTTVAANTLASGLGYWKPKT